MENTSAQNGLQQAILSVLQANMGGDLSRARLCDVAEKIAVIVQPEDIACKPVATVIKNGAERTWMSENLGSMPDGMYPLFTGPVQKQRTVDSASDSLTKMWREAAAQSTDASISPLHFARTLLD